MEEIDRQAARWDRWAAHYDELPTRRDAELSARRLAELAPPGPALELGCGTGQVAIALARRGTDVTGLDASPKMVAAFNAKTADLPARALVGDMTRIDNLTGRYALIYVVASTLFSLTTQDDQTDCFQAAARHLQPDGIFVVESYLPDWTGQKQAMAVRAIGDDSMRWSAMTHDPVTQTVRSQEVHATPEGVKMLPNHIRYAWPSELDLMARLAALRLKIRHGDWEGGSFKAHSTRQLSVYTLDSSDDS